MFSALLNISRFDAQNVTIKQESFSLSDLATDLNHSCWPQAQSKGLAFHFVYQDATVEGDLQLLKQALLNIISNAIQYTQNGSVTVIFVSRDGCLSVEVADTGKGIPDDVKEKIFEPFFTTKEVGKGTGLGLSMAYGIVKQTGGWILCDSVVGRGTTFRILLPRHIPAVVSEPVQIEAVKAPAADLTGRGTILLVEDEEAVRAFGARALSSRGYTVLEAASGREALDVVEAENGNIDLIVSDVVMPEMDGPTMFGELRKRGIKCKVIFVSGYAEDAFQKNLPAGEDFGFLPKPFTLKQLVEAVKGNLS